MADLLKGIYPPLTTPFESEEVSYEKFIGNILKYEKKMLAGYVLFGSNGESAFLTAEEKLQLIRSARKQTNRILIAGTGLDSIKETITLTNDAAEAGANFALIITPSFFKTEMKHHTLLNYYTKVADSVMIPVILYNVPKFTTVNLEVETVIELSSHPNIIALKDSTEIPSRISEISANVSPDFRMIVGTASVLYTALLSGASAGILALANIAPDECIQIFNLIRERNFEKALEIQNRMIPVNKAVTAKYGVAGLKAAMDLVGYFGGLPRLPLEPLSEAQLIELKIILKKAALIE
ncbi:MAG: dihydrodipicolinate synthase family protein [Ignavibacteriota bacterium]|jgi:4-hydroxy-2-oxoglutarate aldolase|nr:MAG: dihydrodipicolinate synthase family protein [Chlorobiota bacterium]MBE7478045.1 dihydrodipicolinate synthase family protein [Ignavibacteriales bacterium]MBL1123395.1 dihydrodipicolinate synthase family protein [Ignavibacteriota bacterium]MCC7094543.1 dihydrodipicolinate synthase family protein [Ignavibacteriaceae bacterium]MCE7856632.1 dihydrodipicolinate synthase family protein [Ignavibacteria bacterium CHB3]MEB2296510.1 dihydrodipicolinate synthase family protein [Ignavibacteria bact